MAAHHHLPPLFHLPLLLAWLDSVGQPNSTVRNKTSSKTERYPDFALENMSKSCWRPSRFHMTVFPARAARLRRMVTHAWAVIISHAAVSRGVSGPTMLLCGSPSWVLVGFTAVGAPGEATSPPSLHHLWKLCLTGARRNREAAHKLATRRHGSAMLSAVHRNSLTLIHTHTHAEKSPLCRLSLSPSHARCCHPCWCWCCCGAAAELFPPSLHVSKGIHSLTLCLPLKELHTVKETRGVSTVQLPNKHFRADIGWRTSGKDWWIVGGGKGCGQRQGHICLITSALYCAFYRHDAPRWLCFRERKGLFSVISEAERQTHGYESSSWINRLQFQNIMQFVGLFAGFFGHHSCVYWAKKALAPDSTLEGYRQRLRFRLYDTLSWMPAVSITVHDEQLASYARN